MLFHVRRGLVLGVSAGRLAEHVTKPLSVSSFVIGVWVLLQHDGSEHGLEFECLGSNPQSTTF